MTFPNTEIRWVMNGDVQLAVECWGKGAIPLVFAHGWISSRRMWYDCLGLLDPTQFRAFLMDFRGCGDSDRPAEGHTLAGYLSDLTVVMALAGEPAILVGHSMGGRIAQRLAAENSAALAGLILVAPGSASGSDVVSRQRQLAALAFGSRRRIISFQRGAMRLPVSEAASRALVEDAFFAQRKHWFGWYDEGRVEDFSALLINITVPTLVILAAADPLMPLGRAQREIVARIAQAEELVLPECGHNIPIEAAESAAAAITRFAVRIFG